MPVQCNGRQYWQDLLWAINSPDLIRDDWFQHAQCNTPLRLDPQAHTQALEQKLITAIQGTASNRLGHYFETLWIFFLDEFTDWEVLASNQQIYDVNAKNTVGAFDLLLKNPVGEIEHWELAVKFYLGVKDQRQNINWIGPNKVDNFQRKLSHLDSHQLQLAQHNASTAWLKDQGLIISRTRAIAKGVLFYRNNDLTAEAAHPNHSQGRWMPVSDWQAAGGQYNGQYYQRPRAHWLGARQKEDLIQSQHYDFSQPVLFSEFQGEEEVRRVFVVADDWEATL